MPEQAKSRKLVKRALPGRHVWGNQLKEVLRQTDNDCTRMRKAKQDQARQETK